MAIVLNAGVNGLGVIRSLGIKGIPVLALDPHPFAVGLHSKYAEGIPCPDPLCSEEGFIERLLQVGKTINAPGILFPTTDLYLAAVAKARGRLEPYFKTPFPPWEIIKSIVDKGEQYKKAREAGIPVPQTYTPENTEKAKEIGMSLRYPLILKPVYSHPFVAKYWIKAIKVNALEELIREYETYHCAGYPMLIQEFIGGRVDRLYEFSSYVDQRGDPLGTFVQRKLDQYPQDFGTGTFFESVKEPGLVELGLRVLKAFGFYGLSHVEFKRDPLDGQFKMIELNPRTTHCNSLSTVCGMNLPYLAYQDMVGKRVQEPAPLQNGRWIYLEERLFLQRKWPFPGRRDRSARKDRLVYAVFSTQDPLPEGVFFLAVLYRWIKKGFKRLRKVQARGATERTGYL